MPTPTKKLFSAVGTVRIGSVIVIPEILREFGVDSAEVLAEAGLDLNLFDDPDRFISYTSRAHLIKVCVDRTDCDHFGLLVGERGNLFSFGQVGYLVRHTPNVESALRTLVHYFHLNVQGAIVALTKGKNTTLLSYSIYQSHVEACEQIEDGAVAMLFNAMRSLCGDEWRPVEINFAHRKPKNLMPFRKFFQAPVYFNAEQSGVLFSSRWLKRTVQGTDTELHRILQKQVDALEADYNDDFPDQVLRVLRTALLNGRANADHIASLFSIHSRTLSRRLNDYDTSFKKLADQARFEIAKQMLETSELDIIQIAMVLDYADASAFTRAFRRWSCVTPSIWRMEHSSTNILHAPH